MHILANPVTYAEIFKRRKIYRFCCKLAERKILILERCSDLRKQCIQFDDQQKLNHENMHSAKYKSLKNFHMYNIFCWAPVMMQDQLIVLQLC